MHLKYDHLQQAIVQKWIKEISSRCLRATCIMFWLFYSSVFVKVSSTAQMPDVWWEMDLLGVPEKAIVDKYIMPEN